MTSTKSSNYSRGKAFAISGMTCTTAGLGCYFFNVPIFYVALFFMLGIILGFIGAFFIFLSLKKTSKS